MAKTILLRVKIDDKGNLVIKELRKNLGDTEKTAKGFASSVKNIFTSMALFRGVQMLTAGVAGMKDEIIEFNKVFLQSQNISNLTTAEVDSLKDATIDLSNNLEFLTVDIAKVSLELGKMGITKVEDQLSVIPRVADLATSSMVGLQQSLEGSAQVSRAFFGNDMSQYTRVIDTMHGAISATMLDFDDYTQSMKFLAPIATTVGISIEETSALLGKLGDVGIKGTHSGTALKNMFLNMLKPAKAVNKELQTMNLEQMNMVEILAELKNRGLNAIDFLDTLNLRAIVSGLALAGMKDEVNSLNRSLDNGAFSTEKTAKGIRLSWDAQMKQLSTSFKNIFTEFSRAFEGISTSGAFDNLKNSFVSLQRVIREHRTEIKEWVQGFINGLVSIGRFIKNHFQDFKTFFAVVAGVKIFQWVDKLVILNTVKTTGVDALTRSVGNMNIMVNAGAIALTTMLALIDQWEKRSKAFVDVGGNVGVKGTENKIKALIELQSLIEKREDNIANPKGLRGFLGGKGVAWSDYYLGVDELSKKFRLPEAFFKMSDTMPKLNKNLGDLHMNLVRISDVKNEDNNSFFGINDEFAEKAAARVKDLEESIGKTLKTILKAKDAVKDLEGGIFTPIKDVSVLGKANIPELDSYNTFIGQHKKPFLPEYNPRILDESLKNYKEFLDYKAGIDEEFAANRVRLAKEEERRRKEEEERRKADLKTNLESINSLIRSTSDGVVMFLEGTSKYANRNFEEETKAVEEKYARQLALAEGDDAKKRKILRRQAAEQEKIRKDQEAARKEEARRNQEAAAFNSFINTAVAVTGVLAQQQGGLATRLLSAAAIAAAGGIEIAAILNKKFSTGGMVKGNGNETSDNLLARVSPGERILSGSETRELGGEAGIKRLLDDRKSRRARGDTINVYNPIGEKEYVRDVFRQVTKERRRRY